MAENIGADPIKGNGLLTTITQRLTKAYKANDGAFIEQLDAFIKMPEQKRNEVFGIKKPEEKISKIRLVDTVMVSALTDKFDPSKHFTENKTVKYWLGDNFKLHVLGPVKVAIENLPQAEFNKFIFDTQINDSEIMENFSITKESGLMTREEVLWTIADLTDKQPKGEAGKLLTNGYSTIIGYILCEDGVARVVLVDWFSGDAGWYCDCRDLVSWSDGNEMLSRKVAWFFKY